MERAPPPTAAGEPTVVKPTRDPDRGKGRALAFDIVAILDIARYRRLPKTVLVATLSA
jgi:hypothetical protein